MLNYVFKGVSFTLNWYIISSVFPFWIVRELYCALLYYPFSQFFTTLRFASSCITLCSICNSKVTTICISNTGYDFPIQWYT